MDNKFPVLILNWMRPKNIQNNILPQLLKEDCVSKIIIAHGNHDTVFGVESLADGEIKKIGNVWHIGNYIGNRTLRCFRRWELIYKLREDGLLNEECILVQDDDIVFEAKEISKFVKLYMDKKGVFISGSSGRNIIYDKYVYNSIYGNCDLVIGQSIFGNIDKICAAVKKIKTQNIPKDIIIYEDDITMNYFVLDDKLIKNKQHYSVKLNCKFLLDNNSISSRPNHLEMRNRTLKYLLDLSI